MMEVEVEVEVEVWIFHHIFHDLVLYIHSYLHTKHSSFPDSHHTKMMWNNNGSQYTWCCHGQDHISHSLIQ